MVARPDGNGGMAHGHVSLRKRDRPGPEQPASLSLSLSLREAATPGIERQGPRGLEVEGSSS